MRALLTQPVFSALSLSLTSSNLGAFTAGRGLRQALGGRERPAVPGQAGGQCRAEGAARVGSSLELQGRGKLQASNCVKTFSGKDVWGLQSQGALPTAGL